MVVSSPDRGSHRTRLIEAARRLLREREYGKITARDLVAASNTNLGSIGYHFGSKEALLNEAIGLALEEWAEALIHPLQPGEASGPPALLASLIRVLDDYDEVRPYYQAFIEAVARSARSPALRQQLADHYNRQRDRVAAWVTGSLGEMLNDDQARNLASVLIGTVDGLLIQTFIEPNDTVNGQDIAQATLGMVAAYRGATPAATP